MVKMLILENSGLKKIRRIDMNEICVAAYDFQSWCHGNETSERVYEHLDDVKGAEMTRYYLKAKQILGKNRAFLDEMIEQLMEKKTLTYKDIKVIRDKYLV